MTIVIRRSLVHVRFNGTVARRRVASPSFAFDREQYTVTVTEPKEVTTTPYSDKLYQPIISEGFHGLEKLVIPKDFVAKNQEMVFENDLEKEQQKQLEEIANEFQAPIKVSIGYGSGVFPQDGYNSTDKPQIDFINVVENNDAFHRKNLEQFPNHYPIKSLSLIRLIQGSYGIYFNPFITLRNRVIKYGVMSTNALLLDLSEWSSLYFAGRLHKPVNFIKVDEKMVKFLNQYNLKNATTLSVLLLENDEFTERELYEQITRISYLGDFRMYVGGENPNKVQNIVSKQLKQFNKLYEPIIDYFINKKILTVVGTGSTRQFRKNLTINNKITLISTLPLQFRIKLYQKYRDKSIKDIVRDKDLQNNLVLIVRRTIQISSLKQLIRGVFSSGVLKLLKYAFSKMSKFWRAKML